MTEKQNENQSTKEVKIKKSRTRSPNYPSIGLEESIQRARELQEAAGNNPILVSTAWKVWDYKKSSGNQVVAALDAFELLDVEGVGDKRRVQLTTEARKILAEHSDTSDILAELGVKPDLHKELWDKYAGELPPSDQVIAEYLEFERDFNPKYINKFIEQFRDTLEFADVTKPDEIFSSDKSEIKEPRQDGQMRQASSQPPRSVNNSNDSPKEVDLKFRLSKDRAVVLNFIGNGELTQEDIQFVSDMLKVQMRQFPTQEEIDARPKKAMWRNKDHDIPVEVAESLGKKDGEEYIRVKGSKTGIPKKEIEILED